MQLDIGIEFFLILFVVVAGISRPLQLFVPNKRKELGVVIERYSIWFILLLFYLVLFSSFFEYISRGVKLNITITVIGILLTVISRVIRNSAINALGKYWSVYVEIRHKQSLITAGPYKFIRHPGHLASILEGIAIPLVFNAWVLLVLSAMMHIYLFYKRAKLEEKTFSTTMNGEYESYKNRTGMFFPVPENFF